MLPSARRFSNYGSKPSDVSGAPTTQDVTSASLTNILRSSMDDENGYVRDKLGQTSKIKENKIRNGEAVTFVNFLLDSRFWVISIFVLIAVTILDATYFLQSKRYIDMKLQDVSIDLRGENGYDVAAKIEISANLRSFLHALRVDQATCSLYAWQNPTEVERNSSTTSISKSIPRTGDELVTNLVLLSGASVKPQPVISQFYSSRAERKGSVTTGAVEIGAENTNYGLLRRYAINGILNDESFKNDFPLLAMQCSISSYFELYSVFPLRLSTFNYRWRQKPQHKEPHESTSNSSATASIRTSSNSSTDSTRSGRRILSAVRFSEASELAEYFIGLITEYADKLRTLTREQLQIRFKEPHVSSIGASVIVAATWGLNADFLTSPLSVTVPALQLGVGPEVVDPSVTSSTNTATAWSFSTTAFTLTLNPKGTPQSTTIYAHATCITEYSSQRPCTLLQPLQTFLDTYGDGSGNIRTFFIGSSNAVTNLIGRRHQLKYTSTVYSESLYDRRRNRRLQGVPVDPLNVKGAQPSHHFDSSDTVSHITGTSAAHGVVLKASSQSYSYNARCLELTADSFQFADICYKLNTNGHFASHVDILYSSNESPLVHFSSVLQWPSSISGDDTMKEISLRGVVKLLGSTLLDGEASVAYESGAYSVSVYESTYSLSGSAYGTYDVTAPSNSWSFGCSSVYLAIGGLDLPSLNSVSGSIAYQANTGYQSPGYLQFSATGGEASVSAYVKWEVSAPSERLVLSVRSDVIPSSAGDGSLSVDSALGFLVSLGELLTGTNYLTLGYSDGSIYLYGNILPSRADIDLDLNATGTYGVDDAFKWKVALAVPSRKGYYYSGSSLVLDVNADRHSSDGGMITLRIATGANAPYALNGSVAMSYGGGTFNLTVAESELLDMDASLRGTYFAPSSYSWRVSVSKVALSILGGSPDMTAGALNITADLNTYPASGVIRAYLVGPKYFPLAGSMHFSYGSGMFSMDFTERKYSLGGAIAGNYSVTDANKWSFAINRANVAASDLFSYSGLSASIAYDIPVRVDGSSTGSVGSVQISAKETSPVLFHIMNDVSWDVANLEQRMSLSLASNVYIPRVININLTDSIGYGSTSAPTLPPTMQPSCRPTAEPSSTPSSKPSSQPSSKPSSKSSSQPSTESSKWPSSEPSTMPSTIPTAFSNSSVPTTSITSAPTSVPTEKQVPYITSMLLDAGSNFITANVTLESPVSGVDYSGTLYCAALTNGTFPSSVGAVKVGGSSVSYTSMMNSTLDITMAGLQALTNYAVFCYNENSLGYGNSLSEVIATRRSIQTECCKTMSFTNSPIFVYGDISKYTSSSSSQSYVFTYVLNSAPSSSVLITPIITTTSSSLSTATVTAIPSSVSMTNSTYPLQGKFVLSASSLTSSGTFTVTLNVTGSSAAEFSTLSTSVKIITSTDAVPAPSLSYAIFSDNGAYVTIVFDGATDLGRISDGTWACSKLFNFTGASYTTCSWLNSTSVKGTFDTKQSLLLSVGDDITVYSGNIRAACTDSMNCTANYVNDEATVAALSPYDPVVPTVVLSSPSSIGACDSLTLDASASSGDGGRGWYSIEWSVSTSSSSSSSAATKLEDTLDSVSVISKPITISRSALSQTTYYITLTLKNFLGQFASQTVVVAVSGDRTLPTASIVGSTQLTIKAMDALSILAIGKVSACAANDTLTLEYTWSIYSGSDSDDNTDSSSTALDISSKSADKRKFSLSAFTLTAGQTYTVKVSVVANDTSSGVASSAATASASVYVEHGDVVASVIGGYTRSTPVDQKLTLSAASSYDEDSQSGTSTLYYSWTCAILSVGSKFGSECGIYNTESSNVTVTTDSSTLKLPANAMTSGTSYGYTVVVSASDGRYSYATVVVTPSGAGAASVLITSTKMKFNADSTLALTGYISASCAITATWNVYFAGSEVLFTALTSLSQNFTTAEAKSKISYPFATAADVFTAGRTYTYRLTAGSLDGSYDASYGEVSLVVNAPPYGGAAYSDPESGKGLETVFTVYSSGWVDDVSDYPLVYAFYYRQASKYPTLTIAEYTQLTYANSKLPTGLSSNRYVVTVYGRVADIYYAYSEATLGVNVTTNNNFNATNYLSTNLAKSLLTGDTSAAYQIINNVASTINIVNCSAAPDCAFLNRDSCVDVPNTCGSCLSGYSGIVGASNKKCFNESSKIGQIGYSCSNDDDCIYGYCYQGFCKAPMQSCPSQRSDTPCSGHGSCSFEDSAGNALQNCTILDVHCTASCSCDVGYGGSDCSLTTAAALSRDTARKYMCTSLLKLYASQDKSTTLLDSLTSSLFTTFSATEVSSDDGVSSCTDVLTAITQLAADGYLATAKSYTFTYLTSATSAFTSTAASYGVSGSNSSSAVEESVANLVIGALQSMVSGQTPLDLVSDNVRVQLRKDKLSSLANVTLATPSTTAEAKYGVNQPKVSLGTNGLDSCSISGGYSQLSVMQWGKNPYSNSSSLESTLLRFSSSSGISSPSRRRRRRLSSLSVSMSLSSAPTYFITIQFSAKQEFNFSAASTSSSSGTNYTLPECSFHNGDTYQSCSGCNISSYTDYNVTYGCYDDQQLCPTSTSRRLLRDTINTEEVFPFSLEELLPSHGYESAEVLRRRLSTDDGTDDDGGTNENTGVSTYGTMVIALVSELATVLSGNPFAFDPSKAKVILAFVSSLVFTIFAGFFYFTSWDSKDLYSVKNYFEDKKKKRDEFIAKARMGEFGSKSRSILYSTGEHSKSEEGRLSKRIIDTAFPKRSSVTEAIIPEFVFNDINSISGDKALLHSDFSSLDEKGIGDDGAAAAAANEEEEFKRGVLTTVAYTREFLQEAIPAYIFFSGRHTTYRILQLILAKHSYAVMAWRPSLSKSRTARWLTLCRWVLIGLFLNTLFYGICYPTDNTCEAFTAKEECLSLPSKIQAGRSLCIWDASSTPQCSLRPPPATATFYLMTSLMCLIIAIPIDTLMGYIQMTYGQKRPRLEDINLSTDKWLGPTAHSLMTQPSGNPQATVEAAEGAPQQPVATVEERGSALAILFSRLGLTGYTQTADPSSEGYYAADVIRNNVQSLEDEVNLLLRMTADFYKSTSVDIEDGNNAEKNVQVVQRRLAQIRAIEYYIGQYRDGEPLPLPIFQQWLYKDYRGRLLAKLRRARAVCTDVCSRVEACRDVHEMKDVVLIQRFVHEQFTGLKRTVLDDMLENCDELLPPQEVGAIPWILAWLFIDCCLAFFVYWVFRWGVYNGGDTVAIWGATFGIGVAQDVLLIAMTRIFVINYLTVESMIPQLKSVYATLSNAVLMFVQEGEDAQKTPGTNDIRLIQHLSGACRAAHVDSIKELPAAAVLRKLNDADMDGCREARRSYRGWASRILIFTLVGTLAAAGLVGDQLINILIPSFWTALMLVSQLIGEASVVALIVIYSVLGLSLLVWLFYPRKKVDRRQRTSYVRSKARMHVRWGEGGLSPTSIVRVNRDQDEENIAAAQSAQVYLEWSEVPDEISDKTKKAEGGWFEETNEYSSRGDVSKAGAKQSKKLKKPQKQHLVEYQDTDFIPSPLEDSTKIGHTAATGADATTALNGALSYILCMGDQPAATNGVPAPISTVVHQRSDSSAPAESENQYSAIIRWFVDATVGATEDGDATTVRATSKRKVKKENRQSAFL